MVATGAEPAAIVEAKELRQMTDSSAIEAAIDTVLAAQADKVAEYRAGREKLCGINQLLKKKLAG
jgi:aspartyl-tRNA(Asn)/glutamyl-tRNA(Gln) amidotransferase subunit B